MANWVGSFVCLSFKREMFEGIHDFRSNIFKLALYTSDALLTPQTTAYQTQGEVLSLGGYTAGGKQATVYPPVVAGNAAFIDIDDVSWPDASFTARGGMLYNASKAGWPAVFVLDFQIDRVPNVGSFTVRFPTGDKDSAILRIP